MIHLLVWSEEVGKLLREYENKNFPKNTGIYIVGDSLRMEDIKILDAWKSNIDIRMEQSFPGPDIAANKRDMELFLLGRCFEQSLTEETTLACYHTPDSNTVERGKQIGIPVVKFGNLVNKKKPVPKKTSAPQKNVEKKPEVSATDSPCQPEKNNETKKAPTGTRKKPVMKKADTAAFPQIPVGSPLKKLEQLVRTGAFTEKEKEAVLNKDFPVLADCIRQASDASIGLPMLLELHSFDKALARKLAVVIQPEFKNLKEALQS